MSVKAGECHKHGHGKRKILRRLCVGLLVFNFFLLLTVLLAWAVIQPRKPRFVLQDITVYAFNTSVPNFLTSNFEVTILSRNPNSKLGIYYDRLDVYITYNNQEVTLRTIIPPSYQGHKDVVVWSPFVYGTMVPIAPYNSLALGQDQAVGGVQIAVKINGRVRWKVGTFITGRYHLYVKCPALLSLGDRPLPPNGIVVGENAVKYQVAESCSVTV
ncbi:hypothetical protein MLD38_020300 [Melastoma candidum]|uniref:Uncharacterized protein n=1 Tax=Melastoma candidum TaxID=119954 RepID=A0ACB9QBY9_9MYRT|nr:hypothetical protein MLD38_020300 [Melastoma candidum]